MTVDEVISHHFHLSQILLLSIVSFRLGSCYSLGGSRLKCKHGGFSQLWVVSVAWLSCQSAEGKVVWTESLATPSLPLHAFVPSHSQEPSKEWHRCRPSNCVVVVVENRAVDKTCLLFSYSPMHFLENSLWHYSANIMVGGKPTNLGLWARRWTRRLWWITPLILTANRCILNLLFLREYSIICEYVDKALFWSMTPFSQHSSSSWKLNVILGVTKTPLGNWRRSWLSSCSQKL